MISRISVSRKLLLIYALDMVAVIFLGFSLAEEKYIAINFARKELAGIAYIEAARDTLFTIADNTNGPGAEPARAVALNAVMSDMERAEQDWGAAMSSRAAADDLQREGRLLAVASAEHVPERAAASIVATRRLISRVGDQSNLILDPDLDSYYSMSLVLLRFPELVDQLIQIRAKMHSVAGHGAIAADDRTEFLILEGRLTNVIRGIEGDRAAGYSGNPDGSLERALTPGFAVLDGALANVVTALRASVIDRGGDIDTAPVDRAIAESLRATRAIWVQTSQELRRLVQVRIEGFFSRMWEHFAMAGGLLSIILTLVLLVARRIAVPIGHLAEVADRVRRTNDYNLRAKWDSADEIGRLVDIFNTMLERLQAEGARREELAAQTRAAAAQRDLIEAIPTPLTVTRQSDNALVHINQPASVLLGVDGSGESHLDDYLPEDKRARLVELLALNGAVNEFETEIAARGGGHFWALMSARLLSYQGEQALLTTITPITERKRMEEELRAAKDKAEATLEQLQQAQQSLIQAEKMASLGGLVAGVAHEINTPIGIGLTGASTLAAETEKLRKLYADQSMTEDAFLDYLEVANETARLLMTNMNRAAEPDPELQAGGGGPDQRRAAALRPQELHRRDPQFAASHAEEDTACRGGRLPRRHPDGFLSRHPVAGADQPGDERPDPCLQRPPERHPFHPRQDHGGRQGDAGLRRRRQRHSAREPEPHLRSVLHHAPHQGRLGPGLAHRVQRRDQFAERPGGGGQRGRQGHHLHPQLPQGGAQAGGAGPDRGIAGIDPPAGSHPVYKAIIPFNFLLPAFIVYSILGCICPRRDYLAMLLSCLWRTMVPGSRSPCPVAALALTGGWQGAACIIFWRSS
ncbi:MAG: HAMP domain-containing protein [Magnetospirillum sp.]|nr:HAMP domain-containing protein [Magnetospirillum sp.]